MGVQTEPIVPDTCISVGTSTCESTVPEVEAAPILSLGDGLEADVFLGSFLSEAPTVSGTNML